MKKFKKKLNEFIEKLARANESQFGNRKLDCCSLNKTQK
ncbi:LDCC motif putative metal-binding protein [Gudongella sp. SC589]|jgi:hypothetical protein